MAQSRTRRGKKVSHRKALSLLRTFRPADAAFVLHLTRCKTCSTVAARFLARQEMIEGLSPLEKDFISHLPRWDFLSLLAGMPVAPEGDLSKTELHGFLTSLQPDQRTDFQHLLTCERCRRSADKALAPQAQRSSRAMASTSSAFSMTQETAQ